MNESELRFGEWVTLSSTGETGRVASWNGPRIFVCYSSGCTASCTDISMLRPATSSEIRSSGPVGFNRFNRYCDKYDPDCCYMCKARKNDSTDE